MILKCQCCGMEREFADDEAAFQAGWDAPPHFMTHVACDLCPAVCIVLGKSHALAHAAWEQNGRPKKFSLVECGDDLTFGSPQADAELAAFETQLRALLTKTQN